MIIIRYSEEDEEEGTLQGEDEANVEEDEVEEEDEGVVEEEGGEGGEEAGGETAEDEGLKTTSPDAETVILFTKPPGTSNMGKSGDNRARERT